MSRKEIRSKSTHKLSGVAKFFLGFSVGILISVLLIFVVKNSKFLHNLNPIDFFEQDSVKQTAENQQIQQKKVVKMSIDNDEVLQDSLSIDSTVVVVNDDLTSLEDAEFTMDETISEGRIVEEKLLQSKTVKVAVKNSKLEDQTLIPDNIIAYFEVQKWESPIVNRLAYQRKHNVLKIKGMDISKLSIYYINGNYYVTDGARIFSIPNNSNFEKMSEINIVNL